MDLFQLIILGIVQGITEWIPISSKTQVTFVYLKVFQGNPSLVIPILLAVHLGTVVAATFYFRTKLQVFYLISLRIPGISTGKPTERSDFCSQHFSSPALSASPCFLQKMVLPNAEWWSALRRYGRWAYCDWFSSPIS